jgi:archaellum biogenesis ATPase FlaH
VETIHLCVLLGGVDNSGSGRFAQYLAPRLPQRREYVFTEKVDPDNVTDQDVKWALATVEGVLGDFAKIDNGRWQAGNNAGLKVGHVAWALVGHFGGPEQAHDYVVGRFLHACQANGWLDKRGEVSATKTFDYGFFDGAQEPKERPVTEHGVPAPLAPTDWFMQEWRGSKAVESTDTVEPPSERPVTEESVEDDAWELQPLSAVVSERPRWVWNPNGTGGMQLATLGILVGSSEAGKSTMARFFCAGFTRGTIVGEWHATPVSVLYYASEESFENVIKGSLQAHGADMDRVFRHPDGAIKGIADEKKIIATCRRYGIKVIVLDPLITTFDNSTNGDKTAEVRRELEAWHRIAVAIEGIVIGIAHSKKEFRGDALASINGSVAFGEVCRWAFFFVRDKDDAGHRVMSQCKSSVGSGGVHLDYEIHGVKLVDDSGEPMEMGAVTLKGESETTAEQVAWRNSEKPKSGDGASTELEVMEWLNTLLKDGPVRSVDAESHPDNIWAKNTVSKYRKKAGIESKRVDGSWYWATAEQVATGTEPHKEQS